MSFVVYTQSAQTDLLEAWLYIAEENFDAADRVLHHARDVQQMLF
jgi:plasmid stabilization system protein ParE